MLSGLAVGGFYGLDSVFQTTRSGPLLGDPEEVGHGSTSSVGDLLETHYGCAAVQLSSNRVLVGGMVRKSTPRLYLGLSNTGN